MKEDSQGVQTEEARPLSPGLMDAARYLYRLRGKLVTRAAIIFAIGILAFVYMFFRAPRYVEGTVSLGFRGIEKGEYPNGRTFSVEDFRRADVLDRALAGAGIPGGRVSRDNLAAHVYVTPVIPESIQSRWRSDEAEEEYYPSEFRISISAAGLTNAEHVKLFNGLVSTYLETVEADQKSGKSLTHLPDVDYDRFVAGHEYWDIPELLLQTSRSLSEKLSSAITESTQCPDSTYQLSFRGVAKKLETWEQIRLHALQAIIYQGPPARNRDLIVQRTQYRIENLDIRLRKSAQHVNEALRLLEILDQPRALASGQLSSTQGLSPVDVAALDKLIKSDYMGPVVEKISTLQERMQAAETEKDMLAKQLSWLPKSSEATGSVPPDYRSFITTTATELGEIIKEYDRLLDRYTSATVTSLVVLKQEPVVSRKVYPPVFVIPAIAFLAIFIAMLILGIERILERTREQNIGQTTR
jgi:hypothetical protein